MGRERTYLYTPKTATFALSTRYGFPWMAIKGDISWTAVFLPTKAIADWRVGFYPGVTRENMMLATDLGMDVQADGRGCGTSSGWIAVDEVTRDAQGDLASFELRFEQLCAFRELSSDVLRGKIRWSKSDLTQPDGPAAVIPARSWRPNPSAIPATGNLVYTEQQMVATDGRFAPFTVSKVYTPENSSRFDVTSLVKKAPFPAIPLLPDPGNPASLSVHIEGLDEGLVLGTLTAMSSPSRMEVGYYGNIQQLSEINPATGGMSWSYNPKFQINGGCWKYLIGWYAIDDVAYVGNTMTRVNARFEFVCLDVEERGYAQTVRGQVRWVAP